MRFYNLAKITIIILSFALLATCDKANTSFLIVNDSELHRDHEPITISKTQLVEKSGSVSENVLPVVYNKGNIIPSQVDDMNMDGSWDELAFTLSIPANSTETVSIQFVDQSKYPVFESLTNVRFGINEKQGVIENRTTLTIKADEVPTEPFARFQMDGPAWENDKIGFRQYIDGRNAIDLYGKRLPTMALDTVGISDSGGLEDNYHVMLPWGRDILAVGNSLGLGGIAILNDGEAIRLGVRLDDERNNIETTTYQLVTEGPVRSVFTIDYKNWEAGSGKFDLKNTVSIWAGDYGYSNQIELLSDNPSDTMIVGLTNIHNNNPPILYKDNPAYTLFHTFDKQTYDKEFYLGMALAFPADKFISYKESPDQGEGITNTYLNFIELSDVKSFEYHVFAGWELSVDAFTSPESFQDYIVNATQRLSTPVMIK